MCRATFTMTGDLKQNSKNATYFKSLNIIRKRTLGSRSLALTEGCLAERLVLGLERVLQYVLELVQQRLVVRWTSSQNAIS